jgi:hypothetical protein
MVERVKVFTYVSGHGADHRGKPISSGTLGGGPSRHSVSGTFPKSRPRWKAERW